MSVNLEYLVIVKVEVGHQRMAILQEEGSQLELKVMEVDLTKEIQC